MIKAKHYKNYSNKLFNKKGLKENIKILIMFLSLLSLTKKLEFQNSFPVMGSYNLKCFKNNFLLLNPKNGYKKTFPKQNNLQENSKYFNKYAF